jgi:hypothetical protein
LRRATVVVMAALAACASQPAPAELSVGPVTTPAPGEASSSTTTAPAIPPESIAPAVMTSGGASDARKESEETEPEPRAAQPTSSAPPAFPSDLAALLACLRRWESGDGAGSPNLYQFEGPTWASIGGSGWAGDAPRAEQNARAAALIARDGVEGPWAAQRGRCF